jgi:hypothetical protein
VKGWTRVLALVPALAITGCGGGTATPTATAAASSGDPGRLLQLDAGSFDGLVLAGGRVALVEFHSPT